MGLGFRVASGVRVRASSRGLSAGLGPRVARVHVGSRGGVGVSSGVGPFSAYTSVSGSQGSRSSGGGGGGQRGYGPTKAAIAAHERELKRAELEANIAKVAELERSLVTVHKQGFPEARRQQLPAAASVEPGPIRERLENEAGVPALIRQLGNGEVAPVAAEPEPVDRYELTRAHLKQSRAGIPIYKVKERRAASQQAEVSAEAEALKIEANRVAERDAEQRRLDEIWAQLQQARAKVEQELPGDVAIEQKRLDEERDEEQAELDASWEKLANNDPITTLTVLEEAFADNEAPAAPLNCEEDRITVAMQFSGPEAIVPERKPATTPTGKPSLKKRTKTERNEVYREALGSNVLATVKEALAVAPGTKTVQLVVIRREFGNTTSGELAAIYAGVFDRTEFSLSANTPSPGVALQITSGALINLKGKTEEVAPLELSDEPELQQVLEQMAEGLGVDVLAPKKAKRR